MNLMNTVVSLIQSRLKTTKGHKDSEEHVEVRVRVYIESIVLFVFSVQK